VLLYASHARGELRAVYICLACSAEQTTFGTDRHGQHRVQCTGHAMHMLWAMAQQCEWQRVSETVPPAVEQMRDEAA
jgi:hypothetical protein